jgi:chemotaxis protein histidine kinase CheA
MLEEIKNQFYSNTLKELQFVSQQLSGALHQAENPDALVNNIFSIMHQISGTGPMLGFDRTSGLSRKVEKTFVEIRSGEKSLTSQILQQTQRAIDAMIQTLNDEQNSKLVSYN